MIREKAAHQGVFTSEELALLSRVFAATAADGETEESRERRASRILANYMAGITDETELATLSRQPLGR